MYCGNVSYIALWTSHMCVCVYIYIYIHRGIGCIRNASIIKYCTQAYVCILCIYIKLQHYHYFVEYRDSVCVCVCVSVYIWAYLCVYAFVWVVRIPDLKPGQEWGTNLFLYLHFSLAVSGLKYGTIIMPDTILVLPWFYVWYTLCCSVRFGWYAVRVRCTKIIWYWL